MAACCCATLALVAACGDSDDDETTTSAAAPAASATTEAAAPTSVRGPRRPPAPPARRRARPRRPTGEESAPAEETTETAAEGTAPTEVVGEGVDLSGKVVKISGSETGVEADGLTQSFVALEERTGVDVQFSGSRDFETQISLAIESGQTPDIAIFPQPGKVLDAAAKLPGVSEEVKASVANNFDPYLWELVTPSTARCSASRTRPT